MDWGKKFAMTVDYLFGKNVSRRLPLDSFTYVFSKRTGRLRNVVLNGKMVATLRPDGGVALTVFGAELLKASGNFDDNCVTIGKDAVDFVSQGRSVFAKHVVKCGRNVHPGGEVAVLGPEGWVVAVGKAVLSAKMMGSFRRGVAVKVREGTASRAEASPVPLEDGEEPEKA